MATDDAGIFTGDDELRVIRLEAEHVAIDLDVGELEVRAGDDADRDAGAIEAAADERGGVVDRGEVAGADEVRRAVGVLRRVEESLVMIDEVELAEEGVRRIFRHGASRRRHAGALNDRRRVLEVGFLEEVVEGGDSGDHRLEGGRDRDVGAVRNVRLTFERVAVHLGLEGALHLARGSAELDEALALRDLVDREALLTEPARDLRHVGVRDAELRAEILGGQPLVEAGRRLVELLIEERLQSVTLLDRRLQDHDHVAHHRRAVEPAEVGRVSQER